MDKIITNIGGRCMGHYMLQHLPSFSKEFKYLSCPIGNMLHKAGFTGLHRLFNGVYYNILLRRKRYKLVKSSIQKYGAIVGDLQIVHGLYKEEKFQKELDRRFSIFNDAICREKNIIYTYTLNEYDVDLPEYKIRQQLERLSNFININNLIILASKPILDKRYKNFKYNYRNDNFKKVFGDRYFVIEPSNDHYEACKDFYNKYLKSK